jgi:putative transposase
MAIVQCDTESQLKGQRIGSGRRITIRSSKYLNNGIEQDHRRVKRRIRSMQGFKSQMTASITLAGIELVHMMRKQQGLFAHSRVLTLKEQFEAIAA